MISRIHFRPAKYIQHDIGHRIINGKKNYKKMGSNVWIIENNNILTIDYIPNHFYLIILGKTYLQVIWIRISIQSHFG